MAQLLNNMNTAILKVPLGFIRVIEVPLAILAFATTSGYSAKGFIKFETACPATTPNYPIKFEYPFDMTDNEYRLPKDFCNATSPLGDQSLFSQGYVSPSQFFVFTGVISFLYVLAITAVYLLLWANYENDPRFASGDFLVTALLTLFWFAGSCAWASGVSGLKEITSYKAVTEAIGKNPPCNSKSCSFDLTWDYASLNVSLIAGFACTALWAANLWFIYKETAWFKARSGMTTGESSGPGIASGSLPTGQPTYR